MAASYVPINCCNPDCAGARLSDASLKSLGVADRCSSVKTQEAALILFSDVHNCSKYKKSEHSGC